MFRCYVLRRVLAAKEGLRKQFLFVHCSQLSSPLPLQGPNPSYPPPSSLQSVPMSLPADAAVAAAAADVPAVAASSSPAAAAASSASAPAAAAGAVYVPVVDVVEVEVDPTMVEQMLDQEQKVRRPVARISLAGATAASECDVPHSDSAHATLTSASCRMVAHQHVRGVMCWMDRPQRSQTCALNSRSTMRNSSMPVSRMQLAAHTDTPDAREAHFIAQCSLTSLFCACLQLWCVSWSRRIAWPGASSARASSTSRRRWPCSRTQWP